MRLNKRIFALILSLLLLFSDAATVFADDIPVTEDEIVSITEDDAIDENIDNVDVEIIEEEIVDTSDEDSGDEEFIDSDEENLSDEIDSSEENDVDDDFTDTSADVILPDFTGLDDSVNYGHREILHEIYLDDSTAKGNDYLGYSSIDSIQEKPYLASFPSKFEPNYGEIPQLRNQNPYGTCWAHASMAQAEFSLYKQGISVGELNFSELALAYFTYHTVVDPLGGISGDYNEIGKNSGDYDDFLDVGGNLIFVGPVLSAWTGATAESVVPYSMASTVASRGLDSSFAYNDIAHLKNYYKFNINSDRDAAKDLITKYGCIGISYLHDNYFYSSRYNSYYNFDNNYGGGHAVSVVGWDDNFSASNFVTEAPGDGAWLVRNSWSSGGQQKSLYGYFWMSYYDTSLDDAAYCFVFDSADNYDNNYQYDGAMDTAYVYGSNQIKAANVYTAHAAGRETLSAVGFETGTTNVNYKIEIYKNLVTGSSNYPESGNKIYEATTEGCTTYAGFYSIPLKSTVNLFNGETFSVVITLSKSGNSVYFARESSGGNSSWWYNIHASSKAGESYVNYGSSWSDYGRNGYGNIRIKAYTDDGEAIPVNVNFDPNGGNVSDTSKLVLTGKTYGTLPNASREGYTFAGWYTSAEGGSLVTDKTVVTIDVDHTIYAHWTKNKYTVSFNANGGTVVGTRTKTVFYDDPYGALPTATKTGFDFDGWFTDIEGGTLITAESVLSIAANHTLYAHWSPSKVTVLLDANGGTVDVSSVEEEYKNTYSHLPVPTRNGYGFLGWYTARTGGTAVTSSTVVNTLARHTLYAHWQANSITVSFDANGGTVSESSMVVTFDAKYGTLPTASRLGYIFDGWYTERVGGANVLDTSVVSNSEDHTIYAHWSIKSYLVEFDANGGDEVDLSLILSVLDNYGILPSTSRLGYTFGGWFAGETRVNDNDSFIPGESDRLVLVAKWNPISYTVNFDAGLGTCLTTSKTVTFDDSYGLLPVPTRTGYEFIGWYLTEQLVEENTIVKTAAIHTLNAKWKANDYKLHFNVNGGLYIADKNVSYESQYGELPIPYYAGHTFIGWYDSLDTLVTPTDIYILLEDQTLYAKWASKYTVNDPVFTSESLEIILDSLCVLKGTRVYISCEDGGSEIYFTLDGSVPTKENATRYEDGIVIESDVTIKAVAYKDGYNDSNVVTQKYIVKDESADWGDIIAEDRTDFADADAVPADLWVAGIPENTPYTGKAITYPDFRVYKGKKLLEFNKDYTVRYTNNINASNERTKATVTITGKGNYAGSIIKTFEIQPLDISAGYAPDIILERKNARIGYAVQKGTTKVTYVLNGNSIALRDGADFTYEYPHTDSKAADYDSSAFADEGTYTVNINGKGNYTGTLTFAEEITTSILISKASFTNIPAVKYAKDDNGKPVVYRPEIKATYNKKPLVEGRDFIVVSPREFSDAGAYSIIIEGIGEYTGTKTLNFVINGNQLRSAGINGLAASYTYDGSPIEPVRADVPDSETATLTYTINRVKTNLKGILKSDYETLSPTDRLAYDYMYEYVGDTTNIGSVSVNFYGINGYMGTVSRTYKITGVALSTATVEYTNSFVYDGTEFKPDELTSPVEFKVYIKKNRTNPDDDVLVKDVDYTVSYLNNVKAGTATMTLTGKGKYTGVVKKTFAIAQYDLQKDDKVRMHVDPIPAVTFVKGGAKPKVTVTDGGYTLLEGIDYTLSYANNVKVHDGVALRAPVVTITGKGNYKGRITKNYEIVQKDLNDVVNPINIRANDATYALKAGIFKTAVTLTDSDGKVMGVNADYVVEKYTYEKDVTVKQLVSRNTYEELVREEGETVDAKDIIPVGAEIRVHLKAKEGGNYTGSISTVYRFVSADIARAAVTVTNQVYSGKAVTLTKADITVKVGKDILNKTDYEIVGYANNVAKGKGQVTVKGVGNYGGTKTVSFVIEARNMNYTIIYKANAADATGVMKNSVTPINGKTSGCAYKRNGYNFAGWSKRYDDTSVVIKNGGTLTSDAIENVMVYGSTIVLYAQWTPVVYKISYNLGGGVNDALNPVEYTIEDSISLEAPTRAGYTFAGWYLDSRFTPSRQVTEIQAGSTGNKVLYAKWVK